MMSMNGNVDKSFPRRARWVCASLIAGLASIASAQPTLNLPPGPLTPKVSISLGLHLPAYFTVQFSSIPAGYDLVNQTYLGWCVQPHSNLVFSRSNGGPDIYFENTAQFIPYNTYPNSGLLLSDQSPNWPKVNYVLNHKGTHTVGEIQEAI